MTMDPTLAIGDSSSMARIEVFDSAMLLQRVRKALHRHRSARPTTLIHNAVRYWWPEHPPEEVWALPDQLAMHKHKTHASQAEYRFAFGTRADVFDFENVECFIIDHETRWPVDSLDPQAHRMKLRLGCLDDCCRLITAPNAVAV
jgi:hypothetical protein